MDYNTIITSLKESLKGRDAFIGSIKKIINVCYGVIGISNKNIPVKLSEEELKYQEIKKLIKERFPDLSPDREEFLINILT